MISGYLYELGYKDAEAGLERRTIDVTVSEDTILTAIYDKGYNDALKV